MELLLIILVLMLIVAGGLTAVVGWDLGGPLTEPVRQRVRTLIDPDAASDNPPTPPVRASTATRLEPVERPTEPEPVSAPVEPVALAARQPAAEFDRISGRLDMFGADLREAVRTALSGVEQRIERIERRGDDVSSRLERALDQYLGRALDERLDRALNGLRSDLETTRAETQRLESRLAAGETAQTAALERLSMELQRQSVETAARLTEQGERAATERARERQREVVIELYSRLARLESALAAVTNPILLPGEPYTPPAQLLAESLSWDNWKDVGERTFAFADHFNAHRLLLPEPVSIEIAAFVVALRQELTGAIYPNLRPSPAPEQRQALEAGLARLASAIPQVRATLEAANRANAVQFDA